MVPKWLLMLGAFGIIMFPRSTVEGYLLEYQDELANISTQVMREVTVSWAANSELNGLFNRRILAQIGEATIQMRYRDEYVAELLENERDTLSDLCRESLEEYYTRYRSLWGGELRNCMQNAFQDLEYDRIGRFRPQASSVQRIIKTATYQVIRTLAMSDIFDQPSIRGKLTEELQSYQNTWDYYETMLQEELDRHDGIVSGTMGRLEVCIDRALDYQQMDIEMMEEMVESNCDSQVKKVTK
uniref:Protein TsetseEP domain-containing protein n=1 Tax=Anopheles minimus TaxID=112268 RepID=A0A182WQT7_9DIPT